MTSNTKALLVGIGWLIVGGAIGVFTAMMCFAMGLGGLQQPPWFWVVALVFGIFGVPVLCAFSGVPVALRIRQKKSALKLAILLALIDLFAVGLTLAIILAWRPKY